MHLTIYSHKATFVYKINCLAINFIKLIQMYKKYTIKLRGKQLSDFLNPTLIMRLFTTLLVICVHLSVFALGQTVTLNKRDASLLSVIKEIKKQSEYNILYDAKALTEAPKISIHVKDVPVLVAIDESLKGLQLNYVFNDKNIIISKRSVLAPIRVQQKSITGRVTNEGGEPLEGVTVRLKNSGLTEATNSDGQFQINVPQDENSLFFTAVGYAPQEVSLSSNTILNVVLQELVSDLQEVIVQVGYGTQVKKDITGSVASIKGDEILKAASPNISNSLAGRLPGIVATTGNGKPGAGSQLSIRGVSTFGDNSALVVVDGIVRGLDQVDPNEIESISILKDASAAAVYGSRAANGVILVTTKRGHIGKPTINYNGFAGVQNPTVYPKLMNGLEYVTTKNVARNNMGLPPAYSAEEIEDIKNGKTPQTDWYDLTLKKHSFQTQHNISVNGGSEAIRYFMSAGYLDQDGLYDNLNYKRYSVRSNVDANINENLTISVDLDANRRNSNGSGYSPEAIFSDIIAAYPFDLTYNPDGTIYYTNEQHPVEEIKTGYNHNVIEELQATLSFKQNLPFLEGLSLSGKASFGKESAKNKLYQVPILMNRQNDAGETLEIYPYGGWNGKTGLTQSLNEYNTITLNASLNYQRVIGESKVNGILLVEQFDAKGLNFYAFRTNFPANGLDELSFGGEVQKDGSGGSFNDGRRSAVARVDYSYKDRYLLEGSFRADGSVAFPKSKKYGYFPAFSAGWRISEESFIKDNSKYSFIDELKIRGSYGIVGNDRNVYWSGRVPTFQYQQVYNLSSTIISGDNAFSSVRPGILPNPDVTWESAAISNLGFEGALWNGKLSFEIDAFYKRTSNILMSRIRSIPGTVGASLPAENYAKVDNKGIEWSLSHQDRVGDLRYFVKFNGSYSKNKVIVLDEPANIPDYLLQIGRPLGFITGYKAIGFFQSDDEVQSYYPQFNGGQVAGDVKYADVNGDGKVDANDVTIISMDNGTPKLLGGLSIGGSYKNFDLAVLFQGATKMKKLLHGRSMTFFNGGSHNNFKHLLDYWTPENPNALYPRPWENAHPNNSHASSLYLRDASYLRLKSVDLGYSVPRSVIEKWGVERLRVYFSGANLFLLDKMKMFDPEIENTDGSYYPQQRTLNFGLNLTF